MFLLHDLAVSHRLSASRWMGRKGVGNLWDDGIVVPSAGPPASMMGHNRAKRGQRVPGAVKCKMDQEGPRRIGICFRI